MLDSFLYFLTGGAFAMYEDFNTANKNDNQTFSIEFFGASALSPTETFRRYVAYILQICIII